MVETKDNQAAELKQLDAEKIDALRGQLRKLLSNGQAHTIKNVAAVAAPHSSHGDSDGWI